MMWQLFKLTADQRLRPITVHQITIWEHWATVEKTHSFTVMAAVGFVVAYREIRRSCGSGTVLHHKAIPTICRKEEMARCKDFSDSKDNPDAMFLTTLRPNP